MPDSRQIDDDTLRAFLTRSLERVPQEARNRFAKSIEVMVAAAIANRIVLDMRASHRTFEVPALDPSAAHISHNRTADAGRRDGA